MSVHRYPAAHKYEAVRRVVEDGQRVQDVAREMGIGAGSLSFWMRRYRQLVPVRGQARIEATGQPGSLVAYLRRARGG
jgi:transposase-like protein